MDQLYHDSEVLTNNQGNQKALTRNGYYAKLSQNREYNFKPYQPIPYLPKR